MASLPVQMDEKTLAALRNLQNLQALMMPHLTNNGGQLTGLPNLNFPTLTTNVAPNHAPHQSNQAAKRKPPPKKEEEEEEEDGEFGILEI